MAPVARDSFDAALGSRRGLKSAAVDARTKAQLTTTEGGLTLWHEDSSHTVLHREDGPAVHGDGYEAWYYHGDLHRDDGPAVVNGTERGWYRYGKRHREDGPAVIDPADNTELWYRNGLLHRDDGGPAVARHGDTKGWYRHGELHREDGPASITASGQHYYLNGKACLNKAGWKRMRRELRAARKRDRREVRLMKRRANRRIHASPLRFLWQGVGGKRAGRLIAERQRENKSRADGAGGQLYGKLHREAKASPKRSGIGACTACHRTHQHR